MNRIALLGDIMMDIIVAMPREMARGSDVPSAITTEFGGTGANVAVWVAAAGGSAHLIGAIGDDVWGREIERHLSLWKCETTLWKSPSSPTGMVVALSHPDGERSFFPDARANCEIVNLEITDSFLRSCSWLYISGYTLLNPKTRDFAERLLERCRQWGVSTVLDPASATPLSEVSSEVLNQWFSASTVVVPNELEWETLKDSTNLKHHSCVVIKHGAAGAELRVNGESQRFPAHPTHVVDTIGAGDAFAGGLLTSLATGRSMTDAVDAALSTAAKAVSLRGAQPTYSN